MSNLRMLGKDLNSQFLQLRSWTSDVPDYTGASYTGLKSGNTPLADISISEIPDGYVGDFSLPNPLSWSSTRQTLPQGIYGSSSAVIGGYVYLFGGNLTNKIFRASVQNPTIFQDTGAILPATLYGSSLAIIGNFIYLFGGHDNTGASHHVFRAPVNNPLHWADLGALLPGKLYNSQLLVANDYLYLLGGKNELKADVNVIYMASVRNPLDWGEAAVTLPKALSSAQVGVIDGYACLMGGYQNDQASNVIYSAPISTPTTWSLTSYLPAKTASTQFVVIGDYGYLIASIYNHVPKTSTTTVFRTPMQYPFAWVDTQKKLPEQVFDSQLVIVGDRLLLLGGNASSLILADDSNWAYIPTSSVAMMYGDKTRTQFRATHSISRQFQILGFPPWKTDY